MTASVNDKPLFKDHPVVGVSGRSIGFVSSWNSRGAWIDEVSIRTR